MPRVPGLIRVGHKGADHVAPGNTPASFEAALEHGVDMIEFDVLRTRDGRLVLAHDYADSERRECLTLEQGLELFAGEAYAGVELDVDLKLPGYEREVVDGLARARPQRALARVDDVPREPRPPRRARARAPARMVGAARPAQLPEGAVLRPRSRCSCWPPGMRLRMPSEAAARIRAGGCEAHHVPPGAASARRLVRAVHGAGGQLYVWTVDEAPKIRALEALGVDGVITNDPRLFG